MTSAKLRNMSKRRFKIAALKLLKRQVEVALYNLLYNSPPIKFDESGSAAIEQAVMDALWTEPIYAITIKIEQNA